MDGPSCAQLAAAHTLPPPSPFAHCSCSKAKSVYTAATVAISFAAHSGGAPEARLLPPLHS